MASDVVIDNVNYGKPISIGNLIFLTKYVDIYSGTVNLQYSCPSGFRDLDFQQNLNLKQCFLL